MTPEEAQQAQMIAEIKAIRNGGEYPREYYREAIDKAIKIVDSQAQKIAEQAKEIERLTLMCKQEDAQIIALIKERDKARAEAEQHRDARLIVSDIEPHEVDEEALISNHRYEFPLPWETTDSKEVAR